MKILITGDFVINQTYSSSKISDDIKETFTNSDFNIVNLEAPVTTSKSTIIKTGPHLKADKESTLESLKALNVNLCTLANNHILDYDEQGVKDTITFCTENSISTVGAGANKKEASKIFYKDSDVGKIAILNIAENEWSSSTNSCAGANGMDLMADVEQIQKAKSVADFVFVIVHGGHEYYNLPSPRMQRQYRFYASQGADLVVGHHTHCINGFEDYKGVPIYYSLGNFLFTKNSKKKDWYNGFLLSIEIINGKIESKILPVGQKKNTYELSFLKGSEESIIMQRLNKINKIINNEEALEEEWENYVKAKSRTYLNCWSPLSYIDYGYLPAVFNKLGLTFTNKKGSSLFLNLMRCEAHYDISKEVLSKNLKK